MWLALAGVASLAFGIVLFASPVAGALALAVWIGVSALLFGIALPLLAFRLRRFHRAHEAGHHGSAAPVAPR